MLQSLKEVREEIERGDKKYKIIQSILEYMEIVKESLEKDPYFKYRSNENHEIISETLDEIENFITQKLSQK